jgi:hypothetical protein
MRKLAFFSLLLLVAANGFAHAGEVHTYMGAVTMLHDDGSFMMKTTAGKEIVVATSAATTYKHADGKAAKPADLAVGTRVVVTMSTDGKTATSVKIGLAPKK